jgi:hypothetical protein
MVGLVLLVFVAASIFAVVDQTGFGRRQRARQALARTAVSQPATRTAALAQLHAELASLEPGGALRRRLRNAQQIARESADIRFLLAMLLFVEDRPEDSLEVLIPIDPNRIPGGMRALLAMHAVAAHLRLSEWDAAERVLDGYSPDGLSESGRALRHDARAQIRLGRGDARSALRLLDEHPEVPDDVRADLALTRARALAADGRDADQVWKLLETQPRATLERLLKRHAAEPASQVARRILDGAGPYR